MATNPATVADIEARWRPLSDLETTNASAYLDDAWLLLNNRVKDLSTRLDDATLDSGLVVAVEVAMVLRVLRNPDGKRSESVDDYSFTRDDSTATGGMFVDPAELLTLMPAGSTTRSRRLVAYADYT